MLRGSGTTRKVCGVAFNPYDIATIFDLSADETRQIVPVAKALIGNRSAVVIRTPLGEVKERRIPAGELYIIGPTGKRTINIDDGAKAIMEVAESNWPIQDIFGQPGTNVGGMMERVRKTMPELTGLPLGKFTLKTYWQLIPWFPNALLAVWPKSLLWKRV